MTYVAGVDGCRTGWLCVLRRVDEVGHEEAFIVDLFEKLLSHPASPAVIAVDIPIGLPDRVLGPGRGCDALVRAKLGKRAAAVFAIPSRAALSAAGYASACEEALATSYPARRISKQVFHLFPKIREVDALMTPEMQDRVYECHPEAAFWAMNGQLPLVEPKKLAGRSNFEGLRVRRELLAAEGFAHGFLAGTRFKRAEAGEDDFLDACACAWSAARILRGKAIRFPAAPPFDPKGLRMEIFA